MRWCARCEVRRLSDCSIMCFAERSHDDLSTTDLTLHSTESEDS